MLRFCLFSVLFTLPVMFFAQTIAEFPLYPDGIVPNALPTGNREKTEVFDNGVEFTTGITLPSYSVFQPQHPNGQAVIIFPGGGYSGIAGDHEGRQVARVLNESGITAVVVKYRMPDGRSSSQPSLAPLQDAQQAIRQVRRNAAAWKINPRQIGIMGFSAGGHLAATAATHFKFKADGANSDTTSVRPDFVVLIYPVVSFTAGLVHAGSRDNLLGKKMPFKGAKDFFSLEKQVRSDCPPTFLVHAQDDGAVPVGNSLAYYEACVRAGVSAEMHLYPEGGHGFGMAKNDWMGLLVAWLKRR